METIKILGDRVAFTELGYEMSGSIHVPNLDRFTTFRIGKVVAVGDGTGIERIGRRTLSFPGKMFINVDDAVVFQIPRATTITCCYFLKGLGETSIVLQSDCIARIRPQPNPNNLGQPLYTAHVDNVEILGDWILVQSYKVDQKTDSLIVTPDTADNIVDFRSRVVQLGTGGSWDDVGYAVGDSIAIDRLRATPFILGSTSLETGLPCFTEDFFFVHKDYVLGVLEEE